MLKTEKDNLIKALESMIHRQSALGEYDVGVIVPELWPVDNMGHEQVPVYVTVATVVTLLHSRNTSPAHRPRTMSLTRCLSMCQ